VVLWSRWGTCGASEKYDAGPVRTALGTIAVALSALLIAACGSEGVDVPAGDATASEGAQLFAENCAGCHTLSAAGSQGSGNRGLRAQGPNFNQRVESYDDALFAIRNGGFSGAIMPQNIVTGDDAEAVAQFVADYSGSEVEDPPRPTDPGPNAESAAASDAADEAKAAKAEAAADAEGGSGSSESSGSGEETSSSADAG
jgi:mono/diheme cytochrome c family protein